MEQDCKLDPEIKRKWLEALRSGEYSQTTGRLYKPAEGYCCLGVLCKIMGAEEGQQMESGIVGSLPYRALTYKGSGSFDVLPHTLASELGMGVGGKLNTPAFVQGNATPYTSLWQLNDIAGMTFAQIADIIEEQF